MGRLRSPKVCAALVITAWLAALVSFWGIDVAGRDAVAREAAAGRKCSAKDLQSKGVRLEMACSAAKVLAVLDQGGPEKSACVRRGAAAQVDADDLFIPAYSALTLALFFFVGSLHAAPAGGRPLVRPVLLVLGVVLALTMLTGDIVENRQLTAILHLAGRAAPPQELITARLPLLRAAAYVKMGALAAAAAVLGVFWTSASASRLAWLPRLLGPLAAAVFAVALVRVSWQLAVSGMVAMFFFWLAGLIHAVAVAIDPEPVLWIEPIREGGAPS